MLTDKAGNEIRVTVIVNTTGHTTSGRTKTDSIGRSANSAITNYANAIFRPLTSAVPTRFAQNAGLQIQLYFLRSGATSAAYGYKFIGFV